MERIDNVEPQVEGAFVAGIMVGAQLATIFIEYFKEELVPKMAEGPEGLIEVGKEVGRLAVKERAGIQAGLPEADLTKPLGEMELPVFTVEAVKNFMLTRSPIN